MRTPGTESNVKEIYDKCAELARDPANEIINQFSEFANYLVHWRCTGPALEQIFAAVRARHGAAALAGFVAASGSAGTLAAGDYLKERHGAKIAVVEAVECPTLALNGYGEHNIQGIGDKHVPLIHNVTNTDLVIGVSDEATDGLNAVFNTRGGRAYLTRRLGLPAAASEGFEHFGLSSIANILGAIKMAKHLALGPEQVIVTVATDGHAMYRSELDRFLARAGHGRPERDAGGGAHRAIPDRRRQRARVGGQHARARSVCSTSATSPGSSSRALRLPISIAAASRASGGTCGGWCRCGMR